MSVHAGDTYAPTTDTHPCGCPANVVTSYLPGDRAQCSACGVVSAGDLDGTALIPYDLDLEPDPDPQDPAYEPDRPASPSLLADYGLTPNGEPSWWPPHSAQRGACGEGVCRRCNLAQERAEAWQDER